MYVAADGNLLAKSCFVILTLFGQELHNFSLENVSFHVARSFQWLSSTMY